MTALLEARSPESPFDSLASTYDWDFTRSPLGRMMREAVWRRMDERFQSRSRILEVNCGTGEDAVHMAGRGIQVLATDESAAMVRAAHAKAAMRGVSHLVEARRAAIQDIRRNGIIQDRAPFDGLLSNFGGLNCIHDLPTAAGCLSSVVRPGGTLILCLMGPLVPWEWGWFLARGDRRRALRRLRRGGVEWRGIRVFYPPISAACAAFRPWCRVLRVSALGTLMPPPFAETWATRHPRFTRLLHGIERRLETMPLLARLADHYVLELERR